MSEAQSLSFSTNDLVGKVSGVDTSRVAIAVSNSTLMTRIGIGALIAIRGSTEFEYLIAIVEKVARYLDDSLEELEDPTGEELEFGASPTDLLRAVLIGTYRTVEGSSRNTFKRGADSFPQIDRECFVIQSSNLQTFMSLLGAELPADQRLTLGHFVIDRTALAIASGDRFFQRHAAILGSTGSGKSYAVSLILERASKLKYTNIIVFDMHGEYAPLCVKEKGGFAKRFRISGPGDIATPQKDTLFLPYWLLNRDEMLSMLLDRSDQNAPNQASRFTMHVRNLKLQTLKDAELDAVAATFTVDSPIPYLMNDLLELLHTDNTAKGVGARGAAVKGEWEDRLTRFISRLEAKLEDRRYGFMFQPPDQSQSYSWLSEQLTALLCAGGSEGIKIIDFSEVPSDILPVVTGTLVRLLYEVQFWMIPEKRTPVSIVCDEAHLYLPVRDDADAVQRQALWNFERIAKEGRKYGVSLVVVSQRPADVSRTILSQCNNFLALRLTNETDQNVIRRLMPDSMIGLTASLPLLDTGEALLLGDAMLLPTRVKLDRPMVPPDSATRDFWREWGDRQPDPHAIMAAVEAMRRQTRSKTE